MEQKDESPSGDAATADPQLADDKSRLGAAEKSSLLHAPHPASASKLNGSTQASTTQIPGAPDLGLAQSAAKSAKTNQALASCPSELPATKQADSERDALEPDDPVLKLLMAFSPNGLDAAKVGAKLKDVSDISGLSKEELGKRIRKVSDYVTRTNHTDVPTRRAGHLPVYGGTPALRRSETENPTQTRSRGKEEESAEDRDRGEQQRRNGEEFPLRRRTRGAGPQRQEWQGLAGPACPARLAAAGRQFRRRERYFLCLDSSHPAQLPPRRRRTQPQPLLSLGIPNRLCGFILHMTLNDYFTSIQNSIINQMSTIGLGYTSGAFGELLWACLEKKRSFTQFLKDVVKRSGHDLVMLGILNVAPWLAVGLGVAALIMSLNPLIENKGITNDKKTYIIMEIINRSLLKTGISLSATVLGMTFFPMILPIPAVLGGFVGGTIAGFCIGGFYGISKRLAKNEVILEGLVMYILWMIDTNGWWISHRYVKGPFNMVTFEKYFKTIWKVSQISPLELEKLCKERHENYHRMMEAIYEKLADESDVTNSE